MELLINKYEVEIVNISWPTIAELMGAVNHCFKVENQMAQENMNATGILYINSRGDIAPVSLMPFFLFRFSYNYPLLFTASTYFFKNVPHPVFFVKSSLAYNGEMASVGK